MCVCEEELIDAGYIGGVSVTVWCVNIRKAFAERLCGIRGGLGDFFFHVP